MSTVAAGFVGRSLVRALSEASYRVRAGVHRANGSEVFAGRSGVEPMTVDILDQQSLSRAMAGADEVYHFAALVDSHQSREHLRKVNVVGTRNVWEAAASCGVNRALYCSTTAVYGLLSSSSTAITEDSRPRSIEPYGNTKLLGETTALDVAARTGLHTTIIRPVAIFGPGEHTPFGRQLRNAAFSKLLLAGRFQGRGFNYVHVEDVAAAAVHLMARDYPSGEVFNVCVNDPISFEDAFQAYIRVLGNTYTDATLLSITESAPKPTSAMLPARIPEAMPTAASTTIQATLRYSSQRPRLMAVSCGVSVGVCVFIHVEDALAPNMYFADISHSVHYLPKFKPPKSVRNWQKSPQRGQSSRLKSAPRFSPFCAPPVAIEA